MGLAEGQERGASMELALCTASSDSEDATTQEMNEEEGEPVIRSQQDSLHEVKVDVGEENLTDTQWPADLIVSETASTRNCRDAGQWDISAASSYPEDATTQEISEEEGRLSKRGQEDPLEEEYPTKDAKRSRDSIIDNEATFTRNCWDSMLRSVCAASNDHEAALTQAIKEGGELSSTDQQDSLNEQEFELGEQSTISDAQRSIETMIAQEIASIRNSWNFMGSVKAEAGGNSPDNDSRDLIHFAKKEGNTVSAPDSMGSTCNVNISAGYGTPSGEPKDLTMGMIREDGDGEEEVLVTQEDSGESEEELESSSSTAMNEVSQRLNPGRSEAQRRKRELTDDGQDQASMLEKRSGRLQDNQELYASTEFAESSTDPSYWHESQYTGKSCYESWFESYQTRHQERIHAAQETFNCTESKKNVSQSSELVKVQKEYTTESEETLIHSSELVEYQEEYITESKETFSHSEPIKPLGEYSGGKTYKCTECQIMFNNKSKLSNHRRRVHRNKNPYMCPHCNTHFLTTDILKKHLIVTHLEEDHMISKTEWHLSQNQKNLHLRYVDHPHKCTDCSVSFVKASTLRKHMLKAHHVEKRYNCIHCTEKFSDAIEFNNHLNAHNQCKKVYKCTLCLAEFTAKINFKRHKRSHIKWGDSFESGCSSGK